MSKMIKSEVIGTDTLKLVAPNKLRAGDFLEVAPKVDALIAKNRTIRLLIDASKLDGWVDIEAAEKHMQFVKEHEKKVERIAIIIQHEWQHWFVAAVKVFLHPQIKAFDKAHEAEAMRWLAH